MGVCTSPLPENVNHSPKYWPQRNQPFAVTVLPALHSVGFLKILRETSGSSISRLESSKKEPVGFIYMFSRILHPAKVSTD